MDNNTIFSARITNPATGAGAWAGFPIHNKYYLDDIMREIGLYDAPHKAVAKEFEVAPEVCNSLLDLQNHNDLNELNYLAHELDKMLDDELLGFGIAVGWFDRGQDVQNYINIALNPDAFYMTAGIPDYAAYGDERRGDYTISHPYAAIFKEMDAEKLGRMLALVEGGRIVDDVYVVYHPEKFNLEYDGTRRDIPPEYRVLPENRNYLRNAEMDMEQSTGMIDGIINNLPLPGMDGKRPSIAAMLEAGRQAPEQHHAGEPEHGEPER